MKVNLPMMIQDQMTASLKGMDIVENVVVESEEFFLDGPITKRVAVLDFNSKTGELLSGARFRPPLPNRKLGGYKIAQRGNIYTPDFIRVSVFATVLRTMHMFEEKDALGRELGWAFNAPQLLIIPRAGEWANAYYERASHSIQFFYVPNPHNLQQRIYTSLSRDIIAHETGHAILDGIVPDLYDAITPQSLALHEAIADLTAALMAFRSRTLSKTVLDQTGGSIERYTAFSSVAEEFGNALDSQGRLTHLRQLLNKKTLDPKDTSVDRFGKPNRVACDEPHALSEVLSGAMYNVMVNIHNCLKRDFARRKKSSEYSVSGLTLAVGAHKFKRILFRTLDYLPPGNVSFADYGRAMIAADQASHPDRTRERTWIRNEFIKRHIVPNRRALSVKTNYSHPALKALNLETFLKSDWAAHEFANRNRKLLRIPQNIPFTMRPRLFVEKRDFHRGGERFVRECIFKVSWEQSEPNPLGAGFPSERQITVGTTLVIDWDTKNIRALLTSDHSKQKKENKKQQEARTKMLQKLLNKRILKLDRQAIGPDNKPLRTVVEAETAGGLMRVRGAARMLHITGRT